MVSSFLGGNSPSYNPFAGTALGTSYTAPSFGPSQDYSSTFNQAASYKAPSTPYQRFGGSQGWMDQYAADSRARSAAAGTSSGRGYGGGGGVSYGGGGVNMNTQQPLNFYLGPAPTLQNLNLDYQEMGRRAMEANAPYKQQYEQMLPGLGAGLKAIGQVANQQIAGQIPLDVAQQIGRSSAAAKLGAGIAGGGLGRNLTARDLGLSSLQLQQSGADLLAKSSNLAQQAMQAMSPIAPGQVFGEAVNQASINQQIGNQNALNAWQSQATPGQFDVTKGQFVGYTPGSYSSAPPVAPWLAGTPLRPDQRKALEYIQNRPMGSGKPAWMNTSYRSQAADQNARNREIARILAS